MYNPREEDHSQYDSPGGPEDAFDMDEPTAVDKAKNYALDAGDLLKKNWLKLVLLLLVLGIGFFAFDFFIGSIKQVSFSVVDTEGANLSGAGIKIFDSSGNEINKIAGGQTIDLRTGNYTASVSANGYKQKIGYAVEVLENPTIVRVEMEKDWGMELQVEDFPTNLVEGQKTGFFVTIKNDKKEEKVDLMFEGALDSRYMSASYSNPIVAPRGETRVFVEINLKENLNSSLIRDGLTGTIRIRGLNNSKAKAQVSFDLTEFNRRDLRVSGTLRFGTVTEGNTGGPKEIIIENNLAFPVENISFEVDITGKHEEAENWFSFDREIPIEVLPEGDKIRVGVLADVPVGIDFEPGAQTSIIRGKLFIRTEFWEEEVEIDLTAKKSKIDLQIQGVSSNQSIRFDSSIGGYPAKAGIITLKNNGELPLELVNLGATCSTSGNWVASNIISFGKTIFDEIPAKGKRETTYTIRIPNAANNADTVNCDLSVNYNDPRDIEIEDGTDRLGTEQSLVIRLG